jgi:hypothetical protein
MFETKNILSPIPTKDGVYFVDSIVNPPKDYDPSESSPLDIIQSERYLSTMSAPPSPMGMGDLKFAAFTKDGIAKPETLAKNVFSFDFANGNTLYYTIADDDEGYDKPVSLYMYNEGSIKLATDVDPKSIYVSETSNTVLYISEKGLYNGTLYIAENGEILKVADEVYSYTSIADKYIAYISEYSPSSRSGELYVCKRGKKAWCIATDCLLVPSVEHYQRERKGETGSPNVDGLHTEISSVELQEELMSYWRHLQYYYF